MKQLAQDHTDTAWRSQDYSILYKTKNMKMGDCSLEEEKSRQGLPALPLTIWLTLDIL